MRTNDEVNAKQRDVLPSDQLLRELVRAVLGSPDPSKLQELREMAESQLGAERGDLMLRLAWVMVSEQSTLPSDLPLKRVHSTFDWNGDEDRLHEEILVRAVRRTCHPVVFHRIESGDIEGWHLGGALTDPEMCWSSASGRAEVGVDRNNIEIPSVYPGVEQGVIYYAIVSDYLANWLSAARRVHI